MASDPPEPPFGLARFIAAQLRRPEGWFGRSVMTAFLNRGNAQLIEGTLAALALDIRDRYLDAGFGGGGALALAARGVLEGSLCGVDFSPDVVRAGEKRFASLLASGRLTLLQADIAALPFEDGAFDKISTTNTIYFWPDATAALRELKRVLAPGGLLAIGFTTKAKMERYGAVTAQGFTKYTPADVVALGQAAGFTPLASLPQVGSQGRGDEVVLLRRDAP